MSINKVIILGRVGKQPETRFMQSGAAVTSFSVATSEKWTDKATGEKREDTTWHNVTAFAKLGEVVAQHVNKGDQIYVEGKIKIEEYEKVGVKKVAVKVIADKIDFIGGKQDSQDDKARKPVNKPDVAPSSQAAFDDFDLDIPF